MPGEYLNHFSIALADITLLGYVLFPIPFPMYVLLLLFIEITNVRFFRVMYLDSLLMLFE